MQRGYMIRRGYCDGYSATKKDQQWKFPKKIAFKFSSGRRKNVIWSLFVFLNNAHLNSGSIGIGGLPELPRIYPPLGFSLGCSMPFYNFGYIAN